MRTFEVVAGCTMLACLVACQASDRSTDGSAPAASFEIPYEHYVLDNGLEVVLHEDHSDPIVAVATIMHVGSSREQPGRTGFAHFFEHVSFNDSENAPVGANRRLIPEWGGLRNGGTSSDMTIYYEVVPTDAFEKILWIDSDRLGYIINTVTEAALEREKQVVKNEKRQRVDNVPYGHTQTIQRAHLYPDDHPYHWPVIGSLEDLQNATLDDVKAFYARLYGANNATLVIAGDIDPARTRERVQYWFGEIRRGPEVQALAPRRAGLTETRSLMYEDNFATLPELQIVWPTVEQFHEDQYALDVLARLLAGSKVAPLYQVVVEEHQLAPGVSVVHDVQEVAGEVQIRIRANADTDLDAVRRAVDEGLARFERDGVDADELARVKALTERQLYDNVGDVLNKAFQLAIYNEFAGDPGYIAVEAERMRAVTADDVWGVYQRYIQGQPSVMTSLVPQGQRALGLEGAATADVVEEAIVQGAEGEVSQGGEAEYEKTVTVADRSEPPFGETPRLRTPEVWRATLDNGLAVLGIENSELPLVAFDLSIRGGQLLDPDGQSGLASLVGALMMEGTASRTPAELERAIDLLGARLSVGAGREEIRITGSTLARNFEVTLDLVEEMLLEPRWDETEYARLVRELDTRLRDREANPEAISSDVFFRLLYGDGHAFANPPIGTREAVGSFTLDDPKAFFEANLSPSMATFHIAGDVSQARVLDALTGLGERWEARDVAIPDQPDPPARDGRTVYFIDVPGAKQSVLRAGRLVLSAGDANATRLGWANERLGGSSSGRLFQLLRIEKGYTYGASSGIVDTVEIAPFLAATSVRANVTLESLALLRDQLRNYGDSFTEADADVARNQIIKRETSAFESLAAKLSSLREMSRLNRPADFVERDQDELQAMTRDDFRDLINRYLDERRMIYLVVGDAETQLARIRELGYGEPVLLDIHGQPR